MTEKCVKRPIPPFAPGALVYLRSCPHGQPGVVRGMVQRKVAVYWPGMSYTGRYRATSLMLAETRTKHARVVADTLEVNATENPYTRLMRKIDADNQRNNTTDEEYREGKIPND